MFLRKVQQLKVAALLGCVVIKRPDLAQDSIVLAFLIVTKMESSLWKRKIG
ncbi:hypothetical protein GCM10023310_54020 [Paenibacillus vulneris]